MLEALRREVFEANLEVARRGLALYTWGNVSGIDRSLGLVVMKPSGVPYDDLQPGSLVVLDLNGRVVEGTLAPSTDTPSHLALYRAWPAIGGVVHTHSPYATAWAQACRELPCLGTTHADHFHGPVPVTEPLSDEEIASGYERSIGESIVRRFRGLDPMAVPAVLCANHGPFAWGESPAKAVYHNVVLEECAKLAMWTLAIEPGTRGIGKALLDKHYLRKHGPDAYYGQATAGRRGGPPGPTEPGER